jgi:hypothetical protein
VNYTQTRMRRRAGSLALSLLGLISFGFGFAAPSLAPEVPPVPVLLGQPARLHVPGPFGGTLALYGASTEIVPPPVELLGCQVRTDTGREVRTGLSDHGTASLDRPVVGNQALLPLATIEGASSGWTITCDSPAATAIEPLYLITTNGQRDLMPMAAFSFATLSLVLGVAGVVVFRPKEL